MSASRLAIIAAALSCAVIAAVVLRTPTTDEAPTSNSKRGPQPVGEQPADIGNSAASGHIARERQAAAAGAGSRKAALPAAPQFPSARSGTDQAAKAGTAASLLTSPRIAARDDATAARRRDEAVQHLPEAQDRSRELAPKEEKEEDLLAQQGFPAGTRFAARLNGTTAAADGKDPIREKNTEHDGNDGVYFPPNAELAYPHRAGVQDDAGTVALWVEPVDWDGADASVHSFFRLNDDGDGSYRFHLLKDSANLRFQFVTDEGENDVRVPIDWWPRGEGHHVAATWDDNTLRVYVDGEVVGEQPYSGTLKVGANVPGWWGSNAQSGTPGAGAVLKETFVSGRPLDASEIQALSKGG